MECICERGVEGQAGGLGGPWLGHTRHLLPLSGRNFKVSYGSLSTSLSESSRESVCKASRTEHAYELQVY